MNAKVVKYITLIIIIFFIVLTVIFDFKVAPFTPSMVYKEVPTQVYATKMTANEKIVVPEQLIIDDSEVINSLIDGLESSWVTNIGVRDLEEEYFELSFKNDSFGQIYPFYYLPISDQIYLIIPHTGLVRTIFLDENAKKILRKYADLESK